MNRALNCSRAALSGPSIAAMPAEKKPLLPLGATERHGPHRPARADRLPVDAIGAAGACTGRRCLLLLNGPDGNAALPELAVHEWGQDHGPITSHACWFGAAGLSVSLSEARRDDLHGGDLEIPAMPGLRTDRVAMGQACDFAAAKEVRMHHAPAIRLAGQRVPPARLSQDRIATGAMGRAAAVCAARGGAVLDGAAEGLVDALRQVAPPGPPGERAAS